MYNTKKVIILNHFNGVGVLKHFLMFKNLAEKIVRKNSYYGRSPCFQSSIPRNHVCLNGTAISKDDIMTIVQLFRYQFCTLTTKLSNQNAIFIGYGILIGYFLSLSTKIIHTQKFYDPKAMFCIYCIIGRKINNFLIFEYIFYFALFIQVLKIVKVQVW